jgi:glycosyltransferase involved in cell wall biosynthesis
VHFGLCLFTDSLEPSGVGEHMLALAAALRDRYRVAVACPPTQGGQLVLARAAALGSATLALEVRGADDARSSLAAWLSASRVDVFHAHAGIGWEGHEGVRAARAAGVPVVVRTEHLPQVITDPDERDEYWSLIPSVDRFVCVSEDARPGFLRAGVPPAKLVVVRNGIRHRAPRRGRAAVRAGLGLGARDRVVLTVGRLAEQKGHRSLCRAVPAILERAPNARFLWAGDGPLEGELRALARRLGVDETVRFLGRRDDVPDLLGAADLFVLPSLFEGLPLAVLEAMAAGLPVVATRAGGTAEVVDDGVTGHLVPAGDVAALADAVADLLRHPARARVWGRAGRARFEREFHAGRMARETAEVYRGLLDAARTERAAVGAAG